MDQLSSAKAETAHSLSIEETVRDFQTDPEKGLNPNEASQRLEHFGLNLIETRDRKPWYRVLLQQFRSAVVWVLVAAAVLSLIFGDWIDSVAIGVVIVINATIGFVMEWQALRSMEALKKLSKTTARVLRNGNVSKINSEEIVPGDILVVETGDIVGADARLIENTNLSVKESALTGESVGVSKKLEPVEGDAQVADRKNMLFKGTIITRGNARAVVVATGKNTQLGKISKLVAEAEKVATPLEKKLNKLSKRLIILTLIIAASIALIGVLEDRDMLLMIETAIALAVAAIPEGLPIVATIALARGMLRLSRQNVIVKSLQAVQTLGEVDVICTDKTGTLTEDKMYVTEVLVPDRHFHEEDLEKLPEDEAGQKLLLVSALCNNAEYMADKPSDSSGDPVEIALLKMAHDAGMDYRQEKEMNPEENEVPFDAASKYMATLNQREGKHFAAVKGALEVILERCDQVLINGHAAPLENKDEWIEQSNELAKKGLRVLAFAFAEYEDVPEDFTKGLTFLGIAAFLDPPRKDVKPAIDLCQKAGIKVVMVTGDHPETARTISDKTGITDGKKAQVLHGKNLKNVNSPAHDNSQLTKSDVFARVEPAQKLNLVKLYQDQKHIVAMTGDGVNDAPALKKADIGIAMGIRGTEAAREASDLILKDDAFTSIVTAIKQGRIIFENIRHFVVYLLSCNISEILIVAIASFAMLPMPLLPLQILFLNIVTDVFPALALGMGRGEAGIMDRAPRDPGEPIVSRKLWISIFSYGMAITLSIIGLVMYAQQRYSLSDIEINNIAFYCLILAQLWNVLNLAGKKSSFFSNTVTRNIHVWLAIGFCIVIGFLAYLIEPVRMALSLELFPGNYLLIILGFSILPVILVQLFKRVFSIIY